MWVLMGTSEIKNKESRWVGHVVQAGFSVVVLWSCIQCSALVSVDVMQLFMDASATQAPLMAAFMA